MRCQLMTTDDLILILKQHTGKLVLIDGFHAGWDDFYVETRTLRRMDERFLDDFYGPYMVEDGGLTDSLVGDPIDAVVLKRLHSSNGDH